jgi:integrase
MEGHFGTIVKLLILTGQRRGEIAGLQSSWLHENEITLPKEITKNGKEHTFPIGSFCGSMVSSLRQTERKFVFPARGKTDVPFNGWSKSKAALDKACAVNDWTLHSLRRTYRTIHGRIGTQPHIGERLVNHLSAQTEVEKIYDRYTYMPEMRAAVDRYEEWFAKLIENKP